VVETPNGAHFTSCVPDYDRDEAFQALYARSAASPEAWAGFTAEFLAGEESDYQAAVARFAADRSATPPDRSATPPDRPVTPPDRPGTAAGRAPA
jgi:hypothetical protein